MAEPERGRIAEVIASTEDGQPARRGSGYRATERAVLTAAHVVFGASEIRVRFNADLPGEWSVLAQVLLADPASDVAVLSVAPDVPGESISPALFGAVGEQAESLDCVVVGFPRFKLREDPRETLGDPLFWFRDSHHAVGRISPLSNWREGTLEMGVPAPAPDPDPDRHSPWEGMSGAAVWCKGRIIGVVSKHHPRDGLGSLSVARIDRLYESAGSISRDSIFQLAGLPTRRDQLLDVSDFFYAGEMECPYKGLPPFDAEDARFFFGRKELIAQLLEKLTAQPFTALVGASGSGKSSVLSAGLIPAVSVPGSLEHDYHCVRITPTADPIGQLEAALSAWSGVPDRGLLNDAPVKIAGTLGGARLAKPLLLIVDQMEELQTLCDDERVRRNFIRGLLGVIDGDNTGNRVVIAVRTDFYAQCRDDPDLGPRMRDREVDLWPMGKTELRSVIEGPAALVGLRVDPRLREMLLADVGDEPGKLPLLSHALRASFVCRQGSQLTVEDYLSVGRVQGAVSETAEEAYKNLDEEQKKVAKSIFVLCTVGGGEVPYTRRPLPRSDFDLKCFPGADVVLSRLAAARLLTLSKDRFDEQTVEIAHEALIRFWTRLETWLEDDGGQQELRQDLIAAAGKWHRSGRSTGWLYHGANLEEARNLLAGHAPIPLPLNTREFLAASQAEAKRRSRRFRFLAVGLAVALLVAVGGVAAAITQLGQKDAQQRIAAARQLAGASNHLVGTDLPVAQLLAVEAYHLNPDPQTLAALFQAVTYSPALVRYVQTGSSVLAIAAASDGKFVIAGTAAGKVVRWNLTGSSGATIASLDGAITAVASNADGTVIVAATASKLIVWTPVGGARRILLPRSGSIRSVAVSPSGRYIAVAADDLTLYDRGKGTTRTERAESPYAVAMPSDTRLVMADGGGPWQVLSLPGLADILGPTRLSTGVHQVVQALSANGRFVGFSNGGATIPIWNTARMAELNTPQDLTGLSHGSDPQALSISSDGKRVAVADGGTIYVSSTSRGPSETTSQLSLPGSASTTAVQFLGDDDHLISASGNSLALWNLDQLGRIGTRIQAEAPYDCEACAPPQTDVSPNMRLAATLAGSPSTLYVHGLFPGGPEYSFGGGPPVSYQFLGWDQTSSKFFFMSADGHAIDTAEVGDRIRIVERRHIPPSSYEVLAFSQPRNQLIETSNSGSIRIVPLAGVRGAVSIPSPNHRAGYSLIGSVVDPTSSYLVEQFESDKKVEVDVQVIDLKTGSARDLGSDFAPGITFSGGYLLVRRTDADMEVWNTSGTTMRYLIPQDESYMPNTASAQTAPAVVGNFLVQERSNGSLALTQLGSGNLLGTLPTLVSSPLLKTGLSPDGADQLVSVTEAPPTSDAGILVRWELSPQSWMRDACVTAGRGLTPADWQQYGSGPMPSFLACASLRPLRTTAEQP